METENTSTRLRDLMQRKNLRQVDILDLCKPYCDTFGVKLTKGTLSQYVNGKFVPDQDKLLILAMGLDVSEAWLMGFDVPEERQKIKEIESVNAETILNWIENEATSEELLDFIGLATKKLRSK